VTGFCLDNTFAKVFHVEDTSNDDRFYLENCWFSQFANFLTNSNFNSVSWTIHKCTLGNAADTAIWFDFIGDYGGGFRLSECDLMMKGNENTLFQARDYTSTGGIGNFSIKDCRIETPPNGTDTFTVLFATWGKFYFEDMNFGYGATISDDSVLTYLSHPAVAYFRDCWLPGKIKVKTCLASDYVALTNVRTQLTIEDCDFNTSYPRYTWVKDSDESEQTFMAMLADGRSFRPIRIKNTQAGSPWISNITFDTSAYNKGGLPAEEVITIHRIGTNGYPYVDTLAHYLPLGALVTSIKVVAAPADTGVINGIKVHLGSWSATAVPSNTLWINKEIVETSSIIGIALPLDNSVENKLWAEYTLAGTPVASSCPAYLVVKYRAWRGLMEKPATSVATQIGA
jgi:hypothetical protein